MPYLGVEVLYLDVEVLYLDVEVPYLVVVIKMGSFVEVVRLVVGRGEEVGGMGKGYDLSLHSSLSLEAGF